MLTPQSLRDSWGLLCLTPQSLRDSSPWKVEQPGGPLAVEELNSIYGLIACLCFISSVLQQQVAIQLLLITNERSTVNFD